MVHETEIGPGGSRFPQTRWSAVRAVQEVDEAARGRAWERIIAAYWKPVYKYIRIQWSKSHEDARDLTQGFFMRALEKEFLNGYDPSRSRFRTYLRVCLNGYLSNEHERASREKRGGAATIVPFDIEEAEGEIAAMAGTPSGDPEAFFETEWIRSLFSLALGDLRTSLQGEQHRVRLALFERYDLHDDSLEKKPTYESLAGEFGLPVTDVTNGLASARREFRTIVLARLRELSADEEEYRDEAAALFGVGKR